jgi:hypothetical protein
MLYRRTRPARESRLEYARRLSSARRREAEDRAMIAEVVAGKPFAGMFVHEDYVPPTVVAFQSYRAPRATRTGRTTSARRARRSRSTSSKASPDGSSSDGEPHPGRPLAGARSEVVRGGGAR